MQENGRRSQRTANSWELQAHKRIIVVNQYHAVAVLRVLRSTSGSSRGRRPHIAVDLAVAVTAPALEQAEEVRTQTSMEVAPPV